jgi:pSer/pThr/pTyr-binding forkhead associated (FHA) protein
LRLVVLEPGLEPLLVGRDATAEVSLVFDGSVSKAHAEVRRAGSRWVIEDVGSANGTFVNERRLTDKHQLEDQDIIRVGQSRLLYRALAAAAAGADLTQTVVDGHPGARRIDGDDRKVLIELCRPLLEAAGGQAASTATNQAIAVRVSMSEGKVKKYLRGFVDAWGLGAVKQGAPRESIAARALRRG